MEVFRVLQIVNKIKIEIIYPLAATQTEITWPKYQSTSKKSCFTCQKYLKVFVMQRLNKISNTCKYSIRLNFYLI